MKNSLQALLLQALAAMAWADGELHPMQRKLLTDRFSHTEIPKHLLERSLAGSVTFPDKGELLQAMPTMEERLDFVTRLIQMSSTDGRLAPQEARLLGSLGQEFGMDNEVLSELTRHVRQ